MFRYFLKVSGKAPEDVAHRLPDIDLQPMLSHAPADAYVHANAPPHAPAHAHEIVPSHAPTAAAADVGHGPVSENAVATSSHTAVAPTEPSSVDGAASSTDAHVSAHEVSLILGMDALACAPAAPLPAALNVASDGVVAAPVASASADVSSSAMELAVEEPNVAASIPPVAGGASAHDGDSEKSHAAAANSPSLPLMRVRLSFAGMLTPSTLNFFLLVGALFSLSFHLSLYSSCFFNSFFFFFFY